MVRKAREWERGFSGCADRGSRERGDWKCALISSINSLWHSRFPALWSYQVNSTSVVPHLKNGDTELSAFLCLEQKCSVGVSLAIMLSRYTATRSPRALWAILRILCFPVVQRKSIKGFNGGEGSTIIFVFSKEPSIYPLSEIAHFVNHTEFQQSASLPCLCSRINFLLILLLAIEVVWRCVKLEYNAGGLNFFDFF